MGFSTSSKGNDDLAELAAVLEIPVHVHHIVEPECTIDDRLERATREAVGTYSDPFRGCVAEYPRFGRM
jgi:hypothetical protein